MAGGDRSSSWTKMTTGSDEDIIEKLEEMTRNAGQLQRETLRFILDRNGGVSYLKPHLQGYDARSLAVDVDPSTFRRLVPLSAYDDYADYVNKLADGVFFDDDGQPLLSYDDLVIFFFRQFPPREVVNKVLAFNYGRRVVTETKGGHKTMAATSYFIHGNNSSLSQFLSMIVSPKEVLLGSDVRQQMYCHLLCGLKQRDFVDGIRAPYAAGLIRAITLLEEKWDQLCKDLGNGFPSSELVTDPAMRESVVKVLSGPQPDLSSTIRSICEEKSWDGILPKLWPNARYVKGITTGRMMQYSAKLKYYAGQLPVVGADYFASECRVAVNMDITRPPELTSFVMLPTSAYLEFLPFDLDKNCASSDAYTVDFSGVEVGKVYEVVVTTHGGLFRYRLGDVVRVVGFYNSSPQVEIVMKAPQSANEIVSERDLLSAMASFESALRDANVMAPEILEFASFLDKAVEQLEPHQLKVFVEVKQGCGLFSHNNEKSDHLMIKHLRNCCSVLEDGLGAMYHVMKTEDEVRPLLLFVVEPGSFDKLLDLAVEQGSSATQYKPPKIISSPHIAKFLESSALVTISSNFHTQC